MNTRSNGAAPSEPRILVRPAEIELTHGEIVTALCAYSVLALDSDDPTPDLDPDTVRDEISLLVMLYGYGNILQAAAVDADATPHGRVRLWNQTPARLAWAERQATKITTADRQGTGQRSARPEACCCNGSGIVSDAGTVTGLTGWPLPCPCADSIPARVRVLTQARGRSALT